jgi:nucleoside-diphosphate-sugar epimerase
MIGYKGRVGVIGATSIVGEYLLPLLVKEGWNVVAFSRQAQYIKKSAGKQPIIWQLLVKSKSSDTDIYQIEKPINFWICLAPIMVLPEYFPLLLLSGAKHVVAISSTSRFTKRVSSDQAEQELAESFAENEERLESWAKKEKLTFTILRSTMVYGLGRDKNINTIASFVRRFPFFCAFGDARGLRQPLHAQDVALCCVAALSSGAAINQCYNISGGEIISCREMVCRIFVALGKKPLIIKIPLWFFRLVFFVLRMFPRFSKWSPAMAERMNQDLIFNHEEASRDLGFKPRPFCLTEEDLPR